MPFEAPNLSPEDFLNPSQKLPAVADLYPELSLEQQQEIEYNLRRYVTVIRRIYERVKRENPALLTELLGEDTLEEPSAPDVSP